MSVHTPRLDHSPMMSFRLPAQNIKFLSSPSRFHKVLVDGLQKARERCVLASLYIDARCEDIMKLLVKKAIAEGTDIHVLTDYARSHRLEGRRWERKSFISEFNRLWNQGLREHPQPKKIPSVGLFRCPINRVLKRTLPPRLEEVLGVFHTKFYIFDDEVILTGANVSDSYLVDRQDRWMVVKDQRFVDFLVDLVKLWTKSAYRLDLGQESCSNARLEKPLALLDSILNQTVDILASKGEVSNSDSDEVVVNIGVQYGGGPRLLRDTESLMVRGCLLPNKSGSRIFLSSPYLNISKDSLSLFAKSMESSKDLWTIIVGSPETSTFFGGGSLVNWIAHVYLHLIVRTVASLNCVYSIFRPTSICRSFHAKGLWMFGSNGEGVDGEGVDREARTIIGSTNFSERSRKRDLETLFFLKSRDPQFTANVWEEVESLVKTSRLDSKELIKVARHTLSNLPVIQRLVCLMAASALKTFL